MFFQSIYQMMSAGTDLNINIRRTDGKLSVAVMPRRTTLKDEAGQAIVPLILNGTPMELDGQFLQIITTPLQKAQGILTNLETFEQQARLTATQGKATGTANDKKTKEAREKQEKMEKRLKRAEEAFTAGKYSEATTCLRQAKVLADTDRQKQIEARIQEVQKESSQGCLFPETDTQPLPQQPPANGTANGNRPDGQMRMFTSQPPQQPVQQAIPQTVQQPVPRPQIVQPQPVPQYYPGTPQPVPLQPQATVIQTTRENTGREYQSPPQPATEALTFDKDDENDRELLREDPYAEYIDFPQECRMKDETQAELICC